MYSVIRNGQYIESEKLLFGDVVVPKRPHENADFMVAFLFYTVSKYKYR